MLISMLATTLAMTAQSAPTPEAKPICRDLKSQHVDRSKPSDHQRPLGEEPLANHEKAVMYWEGDCLKPIMVRENVGTEQR